MKKKSIIPSFDDMRLAAEWLDENESSDPNEKDPMTRVATWLRYTANQMEETSILVPLAEEHGVSVARLRGILRKVEKEGKL